MRYRRLSDDYDFTFGQGGANYLANDPATVAQSVLTRLRLFEGEWFLDVTEGTPWLQQIVGKSPKAIYDLAIRTRVLETPGVTGIENYASIIDGATRALRVSMNVQTIFSQEAVQVQTDIGALAA